jgi:hypothetical protein
MNQKTYGEYDRWGLTYHPPSEHRPCHDLGVGRLLSSQVIGDGQQNKRKMTIDATKHWGTNIWYAASQHDITCVYVSIFFSVYIYMDIHYYTTYTQQALGRSTNEGTTTI